MVVLGGGSGQVGAGAVTVPTTLPNDPAFVGLGFFVQGFVLDPAAASGVALTNGLETWIG
ncbi:MAG: hypothetical protein NXI31_17480 [bacterium]|nr:hypothetical protein [bacterium]